MEANSFLTSSTSTISVWSISVLIKARLYNLPWLIVSHWGAEVWKDQFQFTGRSLSACNTYRHRQHYSQSSSKNVRKTSGRDNFKLHNFNLAFCNLESSRIIAYHPHLNCTQLVNCHSQSRQQKNPWASSRKPHLDKKSKL